MSTDTHEYAELDSGLRELASDAVSVLKRFLRSKGEFPTQEVQRAKYASVSLSAWAKWEQTSTARAALRFAMERRNAGELPLASTLELAPPSDR